MVLSPISRNVANDYRTVMGTGDAPQFIDTEVPILPVKAIGEGIPKPNSSQRQLTYTSVATGNQQVNVSLPSSSRNVYLTGITVNTNSTGIGDIYIIDASSGSSFTDTDTTGKVRLSMPISTDKQVFFPFPIKMTTGLRLVVSWSAGTISSIVHYVEEDLIL